jgi:hypothetical protein
MILAGFAPLHLQSSVSVLCNSQSESKNTKKSQKVSEGEENQQYFVVVTVITFWDSCESCSARASLFLRPIQSFREFSDSTRNDKATDSLVMWQWLMMSKVNFLMEC